MSDNEKDKKQEEPKPKKQGFWKKVLASVGIAIGEAKFGS